MKLREIMRFDWAEYLTDLGFNVIDVDVQRFKAAVHESAHLAVAAALGGVDLCATLTESGGGGHYSCGLPSRNGEPPAEAAAVVALAAREAEGILFGAANPRGCREDLARAEKL